MVEKNIRLKTHVGNGVYDTLHPETNSKIVRVGSKNLDETLGEVTAQLTQKANQLFVDTMNTFLENKIAMIVSGSPKDVVATYEALIAKYPTKTEGTVVVNEDDSWYFWLDEFGWTSGGIYNALQIGKNAVNNKNINEKSVSEEKTSFLIPTFSNLAKNALVTEKTFYNLTNGGSVGPSENYDDWAISGLVVGNNYKALYFYSDNEIVKSNILFFNGTTFISGTNSVEFTVPSGTTIVHIQRLRTATRYPIVTLATSIITYENRHLLNDTRNYKDKSLTQDKLSFLEKTFNDEVPKATVESNTFYNTTTGAKVTSTNYNSYVFTGLTSGKTYRQYYFYADTEVTSANTLFFDVNGNFLSTVNSNIFTIPSNATKVVILYLKRPTNTVPILVKNGEVIGYKRKIKIISDNENLAGKVLNVLGDSTASTDYTTPNWWQMLTEETGAEFNDYGESGTTIAYDPDRESFGTGCIVNRYVNMNTTSDGVILLAGRNDSKIPIGEWNSTDKNTFFGALNVLFKGLLTSYAGKPIIIMTPIQSATDFSSNIANPIDILMKTSPTSVVSAQLRAIAIRLKSEQYGMNCVDLFNDSGISGVDTNKVYFRPGDNLHQSALGQKVVKQNLKPVLLSKFN